jgi:hypothetical protein
VTDAALPDAIRRRVAAAFANRCAYCRSSQDYVPVVLEIEHIRPRSRGGTDEEGNLCLACGQCNRHKAARLAAPDPLTARQVALFHPRKQKWSKHFRWSDSGLEVVGITACGRATVAALRLNSELWLKVPANWAASGWHPPPESLIENT